MVDAVDYEKAIAMAEKPAEQSSSAATKLVDVSQDKPKPWLEPEFERVPRPRAEKRQGQAFGISDVPHVFLEDIEAIVHLIGKHTGDIAMQTEEFIIVEPKQLSEVPQEKISEFTIQSQNPRMTVEIVEGWNRVVTYDDTPEIQELAEDIRVILQRRVDRRRPKIRKSPIILVGVLAVIWAILTKLLSLPFTTAFFGYYAVGATGLLYWAVMSKILGISRGAVVPRYKKENPKPWYASDQFKVTLVTSVLASIITAFLTAVATVLIVGKP